MEHQQRNRRPSRHAPLGVAHRQHSRERASWRCRSGGDAGAGAGALGDARKMHFFGQICTSRSDFPRSLLFKGANLPKPVHASRLRPTRTPPTPHTHLAHAPHAPRSRPILRCPTVQKTGRFTSPSPISAGHSPPKHTICRFSVPSPPKTSTNGAECARTPHGIDRRRDLQRRLNSRQVIVFPAIPLSRGTRPHHCEH